jgi:predicted nucleic acid-binding protein
VIRGLPRPSAGALDDLDAAIASHRWAAERVGEIGQQYRDAFQCEPVPARAAGFYGSVKAERQRPGLALDENDLWIAATTMALNATLVSRDAHFFGIDGVAVVTPTIA